MHLHALSADDQGPSSLKMGVPFDNFGYWDPKDDYGLKFYIAKRDGLIIDSLQKLFKSGEFKVFGEVTIQYEGYSASDTAFEPI